MFRTSVSVLVVSIALLGCGGGSDGGASLPDVASPSEIESADHAKLAEITAEFLGQLNDTLEGVTDKASAEAARPTLDALVARMEPIQKRRTELLASGSAQDKMAFAQSMLAMMGEWNRFMSNMTRLEPQRDQLQVLEEPIENLSKFMSNRPS